MKTAPGPSLAIMNYICTCFHFSEKDEQQLEEAKRLKSEMLAALKARREALELKLKEKNELLKELCIKEGELTGTTTTSATCLSFNVAKNIYVSTIYLHFFVKTKLFVYNCR